MSGCVLTTSHVLPFRPIWLRQAREILQRAPRANLGLGGFKGTQPFRADFAGETPDGFGAAVFP